MHRQHEQHDDVREAERPCGDLDGSSLANGLRLFGIGFQVLKAFFRGLLTGYAVALKLWQPANAFSE
jgi:hypothetical protein